jgi:oxygen-dependent protoporphyrinogen oxidase
MNHKNTQPIVVIGAGVAGLAATRVLAQAGLPVIVLESQSRVGGRVFTKRYQEMEIDAGAQFIANFYTHTLILIRELDLESDLVSIPGTAAILRDGYLHGLWPNLSILFTRLISPWSKLLLFKHVLLTLRHWGELDIHAFERAYRLDVRSVAAYARQELNSELLEYVLQPLLSGIFYWTPEHTSQAILFPLFKSALGIHLLTLRHGLGQLPTAMARDLDVKLDTTVTQVNPDDTGGFHIEVQYGEQTGRITARGVVCAVPATRIPSLFPWLEKKQQAFFHGIGYSANAITAIGVNRRLPTSFYGLLTPRREVPHLANTAVQSAKNPQQIPTGRDLLVLYTNGPSGQQLIALDDDRVRQILLNDLRALGPTYLPGDDEIFCWVHRWKEALPKFDVGHLRSLKSFADGEIETCRLTFAGDYVGGPFVEGAITSGIDAARRLLDRLDT